MMKNLRTLNRAKKKKRSGRLGFKLKKWFNKVRKRQGKLKRRAKKRRMKAEVYPKLLSTLLYPFRTAPTPLWTTTAWSPTCSWKK